ncbi:MAG: bifunctional oligoribonuclease/PAP phosphatase NrnA [Chloroflexota bacterium]|nr:bifunctional oligoribonuclease/PAP phosphatase NrnA [Chloroflexota bacterium]
MYSAIKSYLASSRQILLISHVAPDGDAIGSMLGLKALLEKNRKTVIAANQDGVPDSLRFLPGWETVVTEAAGSKPDLIVSLDSSDMRRLGTVIDPFLHAGIPLINIDHHVTNDNFGTLNIVNPEASSTCQIVFEISQSLGWAVDRNAAQCLLTGISTDTRSFRTANVTAELMGIAQKLMEAGASLTPVNENVFNHRSMGSICLWGKAIEALKLQDRIIWTTIPRSMRTSCRGVEQSDTGLVSFMVAADEADVSAVLVERDDGQTDVGMRASPGFNVADVARQLGGGGHPLAAGCQLNMSLREAEKKLIAALRLSLAKQRTNTRSAKSAEPNQP